jgi:hypothetical protein
LIFSRFGWARGYQQVPIFCKYEKIARIHIHGDIRTDFPGINAHFMENRFVTAVPEMNKGFRPVYF